MLRVRYLSGTEPLSSSAKTRSASGVSRFARPWLAALSRSAICTQGWQFGVHGDP